jgi:hypothetical protein
LTGDAVDANRPLLQVLQEHHLDYVFQIKENQKDLDDVVKTTFADEDKHYLSMPGLSEKFTCLLSRSLNVLRFLRKDKEPLTAVAARVRGNLKKIPKTTRIPKPKINIILARLLDG